MSRGTIGDFLARGPVFESPELRYELRQAIVRRETALELLESEGVEPPTFSVAADLNESPSEVGSRVRGELDMGLEVQQSWRDPSLPWPR
jgi:hypothetical protein